MLTRPRRQRLWGVRAPLVAMLGGLLACRADSAPRAHPTAEAATAQSPEPARPSSRFRWRGLEPAQLEHVILWVSHVLIRHGNTEGADCSFIKTGWRLQSSAARRSRAEALAIASDLAGRARLAPGSFAALARDYSEDRT